MGELINEDAWLRELGPGEIFNDLREWAKGQAYDLDFRGWLDGGSGARTIHVQTRTATAVLHQVLKLIQPSSGAEESANVALVPEHSPQSFCDDHIVPSTTFSPIGRSGWWLNLQDIGGNDLDWCPQLVESVDHPGFGDFCDTIVRSILVEWNYRSAPEPFVTTPATYLRSAVEDHLTPEGGLTRFLEDAEGALDTDTEWVNIPGRDDHLPNPLALLRSGTGEFEIWLGNGHGDLHLRNILMPNHPDPQPASFKLIDLGRFDRRSPLPRDPAKLLLSVAAEWLGSLVPETAVRANLAQAMVTPHEIDPSPALIGYREVAVKIHDAAAKLAENAGAKQAWRRQLQLVLIGVALRFAAQHDQYTLADRWWFFEVAALATHAFRTVPARRNPTRGRGSVPHVRAVNEPVEPVEPVGTGDEEPQARIFRLPLISQTPDQAQQLVDNLLIAIERLPRSATATRLAYLAVELCRTAERADRLLSAVGETDAVRRELATVRRWLHALADPAKAKAALPTLREAAQELRRYAEGRWSSAGG
jgi:hypothetical protein